MDRETQIRERAYQIWLEEGRPEGREDEHWCRAAQQLGFSDEYEDKSGTAGAPDPETSPAEDDASVSGGGISPGQVPPPG
ncbi:DUF2934 domain-containing protein [Hansschlegelia zhihuaiae]|uniref:DUF2934 domain-containing protein n=1 Tax=Hansschlegelia zhihuaiae TaxID=405005 RepID=A0A4Q0M2T5_9HYPH|nr:DUF2934 domain-containing protein [Hansschlegelia zhihuaiae]RXF67208.1 DUF2934 domain-containing protein [Hansschlegelia zhihuaiae]